MKNPELITKKNTEENLKTRNWSHAGEGDEANVWSSERGGRESGIVMKEYKREIDSNSLRQYEEQYNRLCSVYGELIPQQRIIKKKDEPNSYVLAQQKLKFAERPNIMDYRNEELLPKTREQLKRLVQTLREQYKIYQKDKDNVDAYTLLDFAKKDNFLVTEAGDLKYPDTGILQEYARLPNKEAIAKLIGGPIALLEIVSGRKGDEIMKDPIYTELALKMRKTGNIYGKPNDSKAVERYLRERYTLHGEIL